MLHQTEELYQSKREDAHGLMDENLKKKQGLKNAYIYIFKNNISKSENMFSICFLICFLHYRKAQQTHNRWAVSCLVTFAQRAVNKCFAGDYFHLWINIHLVFQWVFTATRWWMRGLLLCQFCSNCSVNYVFFRDMGGLQAAISDFGYTDSLLVGSFHRFVFLFWQDVATPVITHVAAEDYWPHARCYVCVLILPFWLTAVVIIVGLVTFVVIFFSVSIIISLQESTHTIKQPR